MVVVGGEVVDPAAQTLARREETVKPIQVPARWSRTDENLMVDIFKDEKGSLLLLLCQDQTAAFRRQRYLSTFVMTKFGEKKLLFDTSFFFASIIFKK